MAISTTLQEKPMPNLVDYLSHQAVNTRRPKYGYYYFTPYITMWAVFLFIGLMAVSLGLYFQSRFIFISGILTALYGTLTTIGWALARYVIPGNRVSVAEKIVTRLGLNGNERLLDVGSGRGLYAIETAKQLSSGRVTAIDIWDPQRVSKLNFHHRFSQPTGNTIENARKNALLAGVAEKIEFINMDAAQLDFGDNTYDLVICGFVLSHLWQHQEKALKEIRRVLSDQGRLLIIDNVRDLTYFLLSTPHMFVWSYLRGRKAKRLSKKNWLSAITKEGFVIRRWEAKKGILVVEAKKSNRLSHSAAVDESLKVSNLPIIDPSLSRRLTGE
jgi:arsenite methyltransferase